MNFDTIAAISTPHGKGGVAVLRVSGAEALTIAKKVFVPMSGKEIELFSPRLQIYGHIVDPDDNNLILDDGLLTYFVEPHSFTGENVVEIACHGGEVITGMILSALIRAGAVQAGPGEFTRRAFVNGKISLTSAEAIADLLDAKTESSAMLSSKAVRGTLSKKIQALSKSVLKVASTLWAYLDYPEEDLGELSDSEMVLELNGVVSECERLIQSFEIGRAVTSGIPAAIVGKPNVGKSSFFNGFLGEERAIVTEIPGTTRDVIEYPVQAGRVLLSLSDTAGVRKQGSDLVEEIGIEKAIRTAEEAQLIFALFDLSRPFESDDETIFDFIRQRAESKVIVILTKSDLPRKLDQERFQMFPHVFCVSNTQGIDFNTIVETIESMFISDESALREGAVITNLRQKAKVQSAHRLLIETVEQILRGEKDVASLTIESALSELDEVDGKSAGEKILNEIFSRFCIGK